MNAELQTTKKSVEEVDCLIWRHRWQARLPQGFVVNAELQTTENLWKK
ncbi:hypothetical protein [Pseudomonas sp. McL0111]